MPAYYKKIKGKNYDKKLLDLADISTSGKGDGRISTDDAKALLTVVKDGNEYSDIEKRTVEYIRDNYSFTKSADEYFRTEIRKWAATKKSASSKPKSIPKSQTSPKIAALPVEKKVEPSSNGKETRISQDPSVEKVKPFPWWIILVLVLLFLLFLLFKFGKLTADNSIQTQGKEKVAVPSAKIPPAKVPAIPSLDSDSLTKLKLGFKKKSSDLLPESKSKIDSIAKFLKENPNSKITILGHSCDLGSEELNKKISLERANKVASLILAKGVSKSRVIAIGKGESEPIAPNNTEEGKDKNRRVEFKLN
jgi:outer membrane protein OmpA-like peptidoglycan-associated protein